MSFQMALTRQQAVLQVVAQAGAPQPNKMSHTWRPRARQTVHRIPQRQVVHSQPFELGEDAPGTGEWRQPINKTQHLHV
jgi:hypothetical protein